MQLSLFPEIDKKLKLTYQIGRILKCKDARLLDAISTTINNLNKLPKNQEYSLSFSGGKDSHVLLGAYVLYLALGYEPLVLKVHFADTELEHETLYEIVSLVEAFCIQKKFEFKRVKGGQSYWFMQFALGYPVPDHFVRWCTSKLKIDPIKKTQKKIKTLTGRHLGESHTRDNRLNKCGSSDTCGTDMIKESYDPLLHWSNCLIWDALYYFDGTVLYPGSFNALKNQYNLAQDDKTGSLRMGCFMCPVVSLKTLNQNVEIGLLDERGYKIRLLLEDLRKNGRRIKSPRGNKRGAYYIEDRRDFWKRLDVAYLLQNKYTSQEDVEKINKALESDYSYPQTYSKAWIDSQHELFRKVVDKL